MCWDKLWALVVGVLAPLYASAQPPQLALPNFDHLQGKAVEAVDIHIGAFPLWLAALFMDEDDPDDAEVREVIRGLHGVHVRSYQFDSDDAYSREDVEQVRRQLRAPGWQQIVQIHDRDERSDTDVFVATDGQKISGLVVIVSEPREFSIVHLVGNVDVDKLAKLQGSVGVPELKLGTASTAAVQ
jgi:hypothetical protein